MVPHLQHGTKVAAGRCDHGIDATPTAVVTTVRCISVNRITRYNGICDAMCVLVASWPRDLRSCDPERCATTQRILQVRSAAVQVQVFNTRSSALLGAIRRYYRRPGPGPRLALAAPAGVGSRLHGCTLDRTSAPGPWGCAVHANGTRYATPHDKEQNDTRTKKKPVN
eukprot:7386166-Prymnesium_polylepis.2